MFTKPKRKVSKIYIHCSASDHKEHDNVDYINKLHLKRGWSGIGYHYFINKDGIISHGRDLERIPAAQKGHNYGSIAICVSGLKEFTRPQLDALKDLCYTINQSYNGGVTFHGHCEVSLKTCPVFDYKKVLGLSGSGHMVQKTFFENMVSFFASFLKLMKGGKDGSGS